MSGKEYQQGSSSLCSVLCPPVDSSIASPYQTSVVCVLGEKRNAYRLLVGKSEGKRPIGRLRRKWVDNIRMDLGEVG
jgi:hypothetical protein